MLAPKGFFWMFVAIAFFAMACQTIWVRQIVVPQVLDESRGHIGAILGVPASDVIKLKKIFDDTLLVEIIAFVLSAAAALFDFLEPRYSKGQRQVDRRKNTRRSSSHS
jgi:hypothetical protein